MPFGIEGTVKATIRGWLNAAGWDVVRLNAYSDDNVPILDIVLELHILKNGPGSLLQIGANDGVVQDPVRHFIRKYGLHAVLIEPLPDIFEKLKLNYAGYRSVECLNVAVSTQTGEAQLYRVNASATGLPAWTQGLASLSKETLLKHKDFAGMDKTTFIGAIESIRVPVITIAQVLERYPELQNLMMLQIDTEGHDFEVVKSAISAGCTPPIINFEHKHLKNEDRRACRELLSSQGYSFFSSKEDTIALRFDADLH